jgi:hypothetical protein
MGYMAVGIGYHCGVAWSIWLIRRSLLVPTICTTELAEYEYRVRIANLIFFFPAFISICPVPIENRLTP